MGENMFSMIQMGTMGAIDFAQVGIGILSPVAILLLIEGERFRRFGSMVGLAGQPFWIVSTWLHGQPGMFFVSLVMTIVYTHGVLGKKKKYGLSLPGLNSTRTTLPPVKKG